MAECIPLSMKDGSVSSGLDCPPIVSQTLFKKQNSWRYLGARGGAPIPLGLSCSLPALLVTFCGLESLFSYLNSSESESYILLIMTLGLRVTVRTLYIVT